MMETDLGKAVVVVAWHNPLQQLDFTIAWNLKEGDPIIFQEDKNGEGCAITKNKGIKKAYDSGAEVVCVLDDDCFPSSLEFSSSLDYFIQCHVKALKPQKVQRVVSTTIPNSRGTPYRNTHIEMPVAASMGFWTGYPDFDAVAALHLGETAAVKFNQRVIHGSYFPFCGMNFAFRREWIDCAMLIDAARWDDIWMGWVWEKVAYEKGYCFNLQGPTIHHSRQSNVWRNLRDEVKYIEQNETLWSKIAQAPHGLSADSLRKLYVDPILNQGGDK
jgi:hypothetical protein